ncbi:MAG TPA: baseplate J/gp47 family protein, partial [Thermoanaerobaculia bacterium]
RRHVRLLDYRLHEGCNARVWLQIRPGDQNALAPQGTEVLTGSSREGTVARSSDPSSSYQTRIASGAQVFETLYEAHLRPEISTLKLYSWGLPEFFLPAGATSAALEGELHLKAGDVLVLRQAKSPVSGLEADADLRRAHAVRLSEKPRWTFDNGREITEIVWFEEDALPFPLWVVRETRQEVLSDLAEVHGNIVLADHGRTICEELPPVPASGEYRPMLRERNLVSRVPFEARKASSLPARAALAQNPQEALPAIALYELNERYLYRHAPARASVPEAAVLVEREVFALQGMEPPASGPQTMPKKPEPQPRATYPSRVEEAAVTPSWRRSHFNRVFAETLDLDPDDMPHLDLWRPKHDLLESGRFARDFVVETEDDGRARLRFGDGLQGLEPSPGSRFWAVYRVGSAPRGNVGPRTVTQLVTDGDSTAGLAAARNDVAAQGGLLPEDIEEARRNAPQAFHVQQRCVTEGDYVTLAERFPGVFKAQCVKAWNGSGTTATVAVQRQGGRAADDAFLKRVDLGLRPFLLLGHQLEVRAPSMVPLLLTLAVEIEPGHLKSTVRQDLLQALSDHRLTDGRVGFFYPDNFTFGQPVYLSELIATVTALHGVASVEALEFHRLGREPGNELETGRIDIDRLEIAQCRNDPAAPHRGRIELQLTEAR